MYRHSTINIPISLCVAAVRNGYTGQLSLYCFLKAMGDGTIINPSTLCLAYCKASGCSQSSFYSRLSWLKVNKWIYKVSDDVYVVISFANLLKNSDIATRTNRGCIFDLDYLPYFRQFICSAVVKYFGKVKTYRDSSAGVKEGSALRGRKNPGFSLPVSYLAKAMDVSKSTAQSYFKAAKDFTKTEHMYEIIDFNPKMISVVRKYGGFKPAAVVIHNGIVCVQLPNRLDCPLVIHKMKSLHTSPNSRISYRIKGK